MLQASASPSTCCSWRRPQPSWAGAACASTRTGRRKPRLHRFLGLTGCLDTPVPHIAMQCRTMRRYAPGVAALLVDALGVWRCWSVRAPLGKLQASTCLQPQANGTQRTLLPPSRSPRVRFASDEPPSAAASEAGLADQAAAAAAGSEGGGSAFEAAAAVPERGILSSASANADMRRRRLMYSKSGGAGKGGAGQAAEGVPAGLRGLDVDGRCLQRKSH